MPGMTKTPSGPVIARRVLKDIRGAMEFLGNEPRPCSRGSHQPTAEVLASLLLPHRLRSRDQAGSDHARIARNARRRANPQLTAPPSSKDYD